MPKVSSFYDAQISFICKMDLRAKIAAMAYYRGEGGAYASLARYVLEKGLDEMIREMDIDERRKFDMILSNVKAMDLLPHAIQPSNRVTKGGRRQAKVDQEYIKRDPTRLPEKKGHQD